MGARLGALCIITPRCLPRDERTVTLHSRTRYHSYASALVRYDTEVLVNFLADDIIIELFLTLCYLKYLYLNCKDVEYTILKVMLSV